MMMIDNSCGQGLQACGTGTGYVAVETMYKE